MHISRHVRAAATHASLPASPTTFSKMSLMNELMMDMPFLEMPVSAEIKGVVCVLCELLRGGEQLATR